MVSPLAGVAGKDLGGHRQQMCIRTFAGKIAQITGKSMRRERTK
jgi:hypothetical protein